MGWVAGSPTLFFVMNECFKNIIGISKTNNPCFTDKFSDAAKISTSGLYLDEVKGFPSLKVFDELATHDVKTLEGLLTTAIDSGISDFKELLLEEMSKRYVSKSHAYDDTVGQKSSTLILNIQHPFAGLVLDMKDYKGATIDVTAVKPFFNYDGEVIVTVYKSLKSGTKYEIIDTVTEFTLNALVTNPQFQEIEKLTLVATDNYSSTFSYLFVYSTENAQPRNNTNSCGCGGKEAILHKYLYPRGIVGNSVDNFLLTDVSNYINGLLLKVKAQCTGGDFICQNYDNNQFIKTAIDYQIWRKAGYNAITQILHSSLVSRIQMTDREGLALAANKLNAKFIKNVAWIAENMDLSNNDCFSCNVSGTGGAFNNGVQTIPM